MNREKRFALVRILFGFVWAVDAGLKWVPEIRLHIVDVLAQTQVGQPALEYAWIQLWVNIAGMHPLFFGTGIALVETALALSLITGVFSRAALYCGVVFSFLVWSVPQGFGGPYGPGSTDIDSGSIYLFVFVLLILGSAWQRYNLQPLLWKKTY